MQTFIETNLSSMDDFKKCSKVIREIKSGNK
jgi:hypothetical protein